MPLIDDMLAGRTSLAAHAGAERGTSTTSDWASDYQDPNWVFAQEGDIIGARTEDGLRSNPVMAAAIDSMVAGTLGESGLLWRSHFAGDLDPANDDQEQQVRDRATAAVARAISNTRFDAAGHRTWRQLLECSLVSCLATGNGIAVRQWKPNRPGRQVQATCVRPVHTSRVCNPNGAPDSERLIRGCELDADGSPTAIHVRRYSIDRKSDIWVKIPIYDERGVRQVTWLKRAWHPDQIFGTGWLAPVLPLLRQFGMVTDAYVVAKRIQACFPLFLFTDDPEAMKRALASRTAIGSNLKLRPGQTWVGKADTKLEVPQLGFNGTDHQAFSEAILQLACAALGLPYEVVLNRLTKANLASARAALHSAFRAYRIQQQAMITQQLDVWIGWILEEEIARGRLPELAAVDLDLALRGKWARPAIPSPDFKKDVDAAVTAVRELHMAPSTGLALIGISDHAGEIRQHAVDARQERAQGITPLVDQPTTTPAPSGPAEDPPPDPTTDPPDPVDGGDPTDPEDQQP